MIENKLNLPQDDSTEAKKVRKQFIVNVRKLILHLCLYIKYY
jgi:hypothetical protein